jgi:hypothetical protein
VHLATDEPRRTPLREFAGRLEVPGAAGADAVSLL